MQSSRVRRVGGAVAVLHWPGKIDSAAVGASVGGCCEVDQETSRRSGADWVSHRRCQAPQEEMENQSLPVSQEAYEIIPDASRERMRCALERERERLLGQMELLPRVDHEVWAAGRELFQTDEDLARWMAGAASSLSGVTPLEVLETPQGRARVLQVLGALANGNYL